MSNVLIDRGTMGAIAESIRSKTGAADPMKPREMPGAIDSIPSGGGGSAADPELPLPHGKKFLLQIFFHVRVFTDDPCTVPAGR